MNGGIGDIYPPLVRSTEEVGVVRSELEQELGFKAPVKVYAGGGDNACGAIGAGIIMVTIRFVVSGHQVLYSMLKAKATMNTRTTYISLIIAFHKHSMLWE